MELFLLFSPLCVKVTKTFVLLSWHVTVNVHDVRTTVCHVMMMYSKERYMENLPPSHAANILWEMLPIKVHPNNVNFFQ